MHRAQRILKDNSHPSNSLQKIQTYLLLYHQTINMYLSGTHPQHSIMLFFFVVLLSAQSLKDAKRQDAPQHQESGHPDAFLQKIQKYPLLYHQTASSFFPPAFRLLNTCSTLLPVQVQKYPPPSHQTTEQLLLSGCETPQELKKQTFKINRAELELLLLLFVTFIPGCLHYP